MSDIILGIESSCDDTSAAVVRDGLLLSNVIASQRCTRIMAVLCPNWPPALTFRTLCLL